MCTCTWSKTLEKIHLSSRNKNCSITQQNCVNNNNNGPVCKALSGSYKHSFYSKMWMVAVFTGHSRKLYFITTRLLFTPLIFCRVSLNPTWLKNETHKSNTRTILYTSPEISPTVTGTRFHMHAMVNKRCGMQERYTFGVDNNNVSL